MLDSDVSTSRINTDGSSPKRIGTLAHRERTKKWSARTSRNWNGSPTFIWYSRGASSRTKSQSLLPYTSVRVSTTSPDLGRSRENSSLWSKYSILTLRTMRSSAISTTSNGAADQRRTRRRACPPQRPFAATACSSARSARGQADGNPQRRSRDAQRPANGHTDGFGDPSAG